MVPNYWVLTLRKLAGSTQYLKFESECFTQYLLDSYYLHRKLSLSHT